MRDVLRPFLETWQADFRYWWEEKADKSIPPMERQTQYPRIGDMLAHWSEVRAIMRAIQDKLVDAIGSRKSEIAIPVSVGCNLKKIPSLATTEIPPRTIMSERFNFERV
jgi:hypothetical protein